MFAGFVGVDEFKRNVGHYLRVAQAAVGRGGHPQLECIVCGGLQFLQFVHVAFVHEADEAVAFLEVEEQFVEDDGLLAGRVDVFRLADEDGHDAPGQQQNAHHDGQGRQQAAFGCAGHLPVEHDGCNAQHDEHQA